MKAYKWLEIATYKEDGTKIEYDDWDLPAVIECLTDHVNILKQQKEHNGN